MVKKEEYMFLNKRRYFSLKERISLYLFTTRSLLQIKINAINTIVIPPSCNLAGLNG